MKRTALDIYDDMPKSMKRYISNYGWHFNRKAFEYAVSLMKKRDNSTLTLVPKENVMEILKKHGVTLDNDTLYDAAFVYHMGLADYFGSSIVDERHLALYVKDTIDDVDASSETTFRRWLVTMVGNGIPIEWEDLV